MKKTLLIGGGGYVGTTLSDYLLRNNHKVISIDRFIYDNEDAISPFINNKNYSSIIGDFSNYKLLDSVINDVENVVLLGGLVGDPITKKYPKTSYQINELAIKKCIDYFDDKKISKLIFISTCSNYGLISENVLANEEYELSPLSLYAKAKVNIENYLLSKKSLVNYSGIILRFATAFGISNRMRFDLTISQFTRELFVNKELVVFDENTWRPYCHVNDFARLIEIVLGSKKELIDFEVFNAGGTENNYTKKMIVEALLEKIPNCKIHYNQNDSDPRNYRVDFSKVKKRLNFTPEYDLTFGIKELLTAFEKGKYIGENEGAIQYGNYELNYSLD
jgi:nucleoside-diphosphate-sugar epimerase